MQRKIKYKKWKAAAAILTGALALILCIAAFLVYRQSKDRKEEEIHVSYLCSLGDGIIIEKAEAYTGSYVEDGSGEQAEKIWRLAVSNHSQRDIQFLKIAASGEKEAAEFEITTLPAGGRVYVQEKNKKKYPEEAETYTYTAENLAWFQNERSLYTDIFTVSVSGDSIRIENISGQDITNDIFLYYKNVEEDGTFAGGITYRLKFAGGIPAGQSREERALHYMEDKSEMMYLTY